MKTLREINSESNKRLHDLVSSQFSNGEKIRTYHSSLQQYVSIVEVGDDSKTKLTVTCSTNLLSILTDQKIIDLINNVENRFLFIDEAMGFNEFYETAVRLDLLYLKPACVNNSGLKFDYAGWEFVVSVKGNKAFFPINKLNGGESYKNNLKDFICWIDDIHCGYMVEEFRIK